MFRSKTEDLGKSQLNSLWL